MKIGIGCSKGRLENSISQVIWMGPPLAPTLHMLLKEMPDKSTLLQTVHQMTEKTEKRKKTVQFSQRTKDQKFENHSK